MRSSRALIITIAFAVALAIIPTSTQAVIDDFTDSFVSESMNPQSTPPEAAEVQQRDQTPNSSTTRAFLRGAGYTAPTQGDMICKTNAQGVEVCVPSNDIRGYVFTIIRFLLSIVGFLFFGLLVYAGYLWTAAGGNDDAVKKAKGIATRAVIGFAIILAAWAITTFITTFLQGAVRP